MEPLHGESFTLLQHSKAVMWQSNPVRSPGKDHCFLWNRQLLHQYSHAGKKKTWMPNRKRASGSVLVQRLCRTERKVVVSSTGLCAVGAIMFDDAGAAPPEAAPVFPTSPNQTAPKFPTQLEISPNSAIPCRMRTLSLGNCSATSPQPVSSFNSARCTTRSTSRKNRSPNDARHGL